jgi:hypothetical protein
LGRRESFSFILEKGGEIRKSKKRGSEEQSKMRREGPGGE